jgi:hypothetical protein
VPSPFDLTIQRDCIVIQDWTLKEYESFHKLSDSS